MRRTRRRRAVPGVALAVRSGRGHARPVEPRIGSVNLVVDDVDGAAGFLTALGVALDPVPAEWADWAAHHRSAVAGGTGTPFGVDLDGRAFARWWGGLGAVPDCGVVVNVYVGERDEVDRLHRRGLGLGATELKAPHDAFWGARYSVLLAPGPLCVGVMSRRSPDRAGAAPPIGAFAAAGGTGDQSRAGPGSKR